MSMCYWCRRTSYCQQMEKVQYQVVNAGLHYCLVFNPVLLPTISMAYTTPAWVARQKCVTRRNWQPSTIRRFKEGTRYLAVSNNYGGTALGIGEITEELFKQNTKDMSDEEYDREGFDYLDTMFAKLPNGYLLPLFSALQDWRNKREIMTVVPFKINEVFPGMKEKFTTDNQIMKSVKALVRAIA